MKNKNITLVAILFTISVFMAFANGPAPQTIVDTDQIIDGAVTILKTDGVAANDLSNVTPATGRSALGLGTVSTVNSPVPVANGGTGKTTAAEGLEALGGASLNGSSTVAFNASIINGVAPLTAAEKTQALVGLNTIDFSAKNLNASGTFRPTGLTQGTYITQPDETVIKTVQTLAGVPKSIMAKWQTSQIVNTTAYIPLFNVGFPASYTGRLTLTCQGNQESAVIICREGATPEFRIAEDTGSLFAITDTAGKYCVYSATGRLTIKNNTGKYGVLHASWEGTP
jgi:hypothetical protein